MIDTDKKIETQWLNNLKALKTSLSKMKLDEVKTETYDKLKTCTESEWRIILKKLISFEEKHLNYDLIDQDVLNES